jgi:hypothetical protein
VTDRDTPRDVALILAITAALGSVSLWFSKSELIFLMGLPASLVGMIALVVAVISGASRWWLTMLPLIGLPLTLLGLLWAACKFEGQCL